MNYEANILSSIAGKYQNVEQFVSNLTLEPPSENFRVHYNRKMMMKSQ